VAPAADNASLVGYRRDGTLLRRSTSAALIKDIASMKFKTLFTDHQPRLDARCTSELKSKSFKIRNVQKVHPFLTFAKNQKDEYSTGKR
jgi:hypothetical protein